MIRNVLSHGCRKVGQRNASVAVAQKQVNPQQVEVSESATGIKLASIAEPTGTYKGMTRIVAAFNAGSRVEKLPGHYGISHLLRRSCGLSTKKLTQVNLTRHLNQMGATLKCESTREHLIYSLDVPTCFAHRGAELFSSIPSDTLFFHWELKDTAYKLMEHDIEVLNRRHLNVLTMELLHEAAFGRHPQGSGLGNSLYAPSSMLTWYTEKDLNSFAAAYLRPTELCLSVVGHPDGQKLLEDTAKSMEFYEATVAPSGKQTTTSTHDFVGGDVRRSNNLANSNNMMLAWPTSGKAHRKEHYALAIAAKAFSGPVNRVSHFHGCEKSRLNNLTETTTAGDSFEPSHTCLVGGLHQSYTDAGLFGVAFVSDCPKLMEKKAKPVIQAMRKPLTDEEVSRGKALLKFDYAEAGESTLNVAGDLATQTLLSGGKAYSSPDSVIAEIDGITAADVNDAVKKVMSSPKAAMSVVGADAYQVLPLEYLVKA